jgi:uncharacterized protein YlxW (UPF0749 family)
MSERGPTTKSVDEDLGELAAEVKELTRGVADLRNELTKGMADLRNELTKGMGDLRNELTKGMADLRNEFTGFRSGVERELKLIRWLGVFFAGILVAVVLGSGHVVWDAATITADVKQHGEKLNDLNAEVKQHGERLNDLKAEVKQQDGRLDSMARQLETIIRQTAPKAGG